MAGFEEIAKDFHKFQADMKDPLVVGALLQALHEERTSTNLVLKEINAKLDRIESRLSAANSALTPSNAQPIIADVDQDIMDFVSTASKVTAQDVQEKFNYKGSNAASARLNALFRLGLLVKHQAGKKVYFTTK
ncbi:hypothetical protein HY572_06535 [Candidatus Micrarchaeota archaeon]|nr:hypothetical protein [Candidatus Micrarchaeota archaeon]